MPDTNKKTRHGNSRQSESEATSGEAGRAIVSVFLFIHLFVLFVCLSANLVPSELQVRLLNLFRPYTQLLNLDLDRTRLFLTHASVRDVDHRIEVIHHVPDDGVANESLEPEWEPISRGMAGGERLRRYQRLADAMAFFQEDEETTALITESIARSFLDADGRTISQLRCRQHALQSWESVGSSVRLERDPNSSNYFSTLYRAEIFTPGGDQIRILKRTKASLEAAPNRRTESKVLPELGSGTRGAAGPRPSKTP